MASKTVVILGAARRNRCSERPAPKLSAEHRVVLVERNAEHAFAPSFLWLMTGDRRPQDIRPAIAEAVSARREFVTRVSRGSISTGTSSDDRRRSAMTT